MNQIPSDFHAQVPKLPENATEEQFEAWMAALPPCPGILSVDDDDEEGEAASLAEFEAGGGIPHEIMCEWLDTWGTPDRRSFREWYASRNG